MISPAVTTALNEQINREFFSAYLYLALSAECEDMNLRGSAAWFLAKHGEEMTHGLKMVRYLHDQNASLTLGAIAAPPPRAGSVIGMFERTLEHEQSVTSAINDLVDLALREKDHATHIFLQWFVTEQIEEEATVNDILGRLRLFGDRGEALMMIDTELAAAAATMKQPAAAAA